MKREWERRRIFDVGEGGNGESRAGKIPILGHGQRLAYKYRELKRKTLALRTFNSL